MNGSGRIGTKGLAELLSNAAATAALGSALCSLFKMSAQDTVQQAANAKEAAAAVAAGEDKVPMSLHTFGASFLLKTLLQQLCLVLPAALQEATGAAAGAAAAAAAAAAASSSSSSSGGAASCHGAQARASALFLQVLICRGLVQLHKAAAQLPGAAAAGLGRETVGHASEHNAAPYPAAADAMMLLFMLDMLNVFNMTYSSAMLWMHDSVTSQQQQQHPSDGVDVDALARAGHSSCSNAGSSSSSSSAPVRWQYLLRLLESRKLAFATAAFSSKWTISRIESVISANKLDPKAVSEGWESGEVIAAALSSENFVQLHQLYHDALSVCQTLTAVAPLPVVCNNPGCWVRTLEHASEAAAARYVCAGCGCRYYSAACQAAGWRSHKKACRRMAACGMRVEGKRVQS
jgi:hypothetical protein